MFLSVNNNQQTKPKLNSQDSISIMCCDMRIHTWAKTSSFLLVTSRCFLLSSDFLSWHSIDISLLFKSGTSSWNRCQLSASSWKQESCAEKALHSTFRWHSCINKSIVWSGHKWVMRQFRNRFESIAELKILFLIFQKLSIDSGLGLVVTGKTDLGHLGCYCKSVVSIKVWKISAVTLCTSCSTTPADPIQK